MDQSAIEEFKEDCKQKSLLAHQIRHKASRARSRKLFACGDPKEDEGKGNVVSMNINQPITWQNFKEMSSKSQGEYILRLQRDYGASATQIAQMMGVHPGTLRRLLKELPEIRLNARGKMSDKNKRIWEEFLGRNSSVEETANVPDWENPRLLDFPPETKNSRSPGGMKMSAFSLEFDGEIDLTAVLNSLKSILGESQEGHIKILFHKGGESV